MEEINTGELNDVRHSHSNMAKPDWDEIWTLLREAKLVVSTTVKEKLLDADQPIQLVQSLITEFAPGYLDLERAEKFLSQKASPSKENFGRVIAPIGENEIKNLAYRNNLPDWRTEDFPLHAVDCDLDFQVHYDITGNSTTEGKMGDIAQAFNDRLTQIRKLIIANSKPQNAYQILNPKNDRKLLSVDLYPSVYFPDLITSDKRLSKFGFMR